MDYVKLVNMEDKPCGISHEFVFRRYLNVHFVVLPSNFFSFVDNSLYIRRHTISKCSKTLLNFVNTAAQYFCITTQST